MKQDTVVIYSRDEAVVSIMSAAFANQGIRTESRNIGPDEAAGEVSAWTFVPDFVVVDVSGSRNMIGELEAMAASAPDGETEVIVVGDTDEIATYRRLRSLGVMEYFNKPLVQEDVSEVLAGLVERHRDERASLDPAKLMVVTGMVGGAGVTTLTHSIAWSLAAGGKKTLLVDLDLVAGGQHVLAGVDATSGFVEILRSPQRLDSLFLERTLVQPRENLSVLSVALEPDDVRSVREEGLSNLLSAVRKSVDYVVVDMPRAPLVGAALVDVCRTLVMVSDQSLFGIRSATSLINRLPESSHRKQVVAINRYGMYGSNGVKKSAFEGRFECPICTIPFDIKGPMKAMAAGLPVMNESSAYSRAVRGIVDKIIVPGVIPKESIFKRLLQ